MDGYEAYGPCFKCELCPFIPRCLLLDQDDATDAAQAAELALRVTDGNNTTYAPSTKRMVGQANLGPEGMDDNEHEQEAKRRSTKSTHGAAFV